MVPPYAVVILIVGHRFAGKSTIAHQIARQYEFVTVSGIGPSPGVRLPRTQLAKRFVEGVRRQRRRGLLEPPGLIVDDLVQVDGGLEFVSRFHPPPLIVKVQTTKEVRIQRAVKLEPEAHWTQRSLAIADRRSEAESRAIVDRFCGASGPHAIDGDSGMPGCIKQIRDVLGFLRVRQ